MPLFYSSNKSKDLSFVYENLEAQIKSWKSQSLSRIGRTTLIKSVAQFTPLYSVATVKFPKAFVIRWTLSLESFSGTHIRMEIGFILLWHGQIYASLSLMEVLGLDHLNASMKLGGQACLVDSVQS